MLWACASWHSGRQQTSTHLLWMFSPPISQDFRVDILPLFRPTVSMLHNPYSYSHSFQVSLEPNFLPAQVWGPWWNCRAHSTSNQKASSREWSGNSSCASREHAPYCFWSYLICSWTIHWKEKKCVSHASFFLALLSLTSFLPKRLKDPPSRVKSYYHHPFFILTTMLRQASTLIRERRRVGDDKATKKSDLRIHRKGHQVDYKSPSYLWDERLVFPQPVNTIMHLNILSEDHSTTNLHHL